DGGNMETPPPIPVKVNRLSAGYGTVTAIRDVTLPIHDRLITAIIGPSGCGKSTLIRCVNRMHEVTRGAFHRGEVMLDDRNIFDLDPVVLRRQVGMVSQRATPSPTMSIHDNVAAGLTLNGLADRREVTRRVEKSLRQAALWDEVKDKLEAPGMGLSG